jgi:hypothetical protein
MALIAVEDCLQKVPNRFDSEKKKLHNKKGAWSPKRLF